MPFGPYATFDECVSKNQDKASPEGFCAWLEHQTTGAWPGAMKGMPQEAWNIFLAEYGAIMLTGGAEKDAHAAGVVALEKDGWFNSHIGWIRQYEAPKMRTVANIRVFSVGDWTDSAGVTRKWTEEDLDKLVAAFNAGVPAIVPLKAGHTPDSFNEEVARQLGVPVDIVTGNLGSGQITLGRMVTLERRGSLLMSAFERVPDGIAKLIEGGQFNTVSVEIEDKIGEFGPVMTAVALLGAEEPAVDKATLDRALVFGGKREGVRVLSFSIVDGVPVERLRTEFDQVSGKLSESIKGLRGAPLFRALWKMVVKQFELMTKKSGKHQLGLEGIPIISMEDFETMPLEIIDLANSEYQGNVQALINWVGTVGFDTCVSSLTGKPGITDPVRVCGWLKGQAHTKEGTNMSETKGIPIKEFTDKFQIGTEELIALATALGLGEDATLEDILVAIEALKAKVAGPAPAPEGEMLKFSKKIETQAEQIEELKHKDLVHTYQEETSKLVHIPGKPEEIAESLAKLEETAGEDAAKSVLKTYQDADGIAKAATKAIGSAKPGEKALNFEAAVTEYSKAHPDLARVACIKFVMNNQPDLYRESVEETRKK